MRATGPPRRPDSIDGMPAPAPDGPAPDATVIRYGRPRLVGAVARLVLLTAAAVALLLLSAQVPDGWILVALGVLGLVLGPATAVRGLRERRWRTAFDATGFWLLNGKGAAVVRWDSLEAVGVYWSQGEEGAAHATLELCPAQEITWPDPVLQQIVRKAEPIEPGRPRMRYRLDITAGRRAHEEAAERWAPAHLWFGPVRQEPGYAGKPPLLFAAVDAPDSVVAFRGRGHFRAGLLILLGIALVAAGVVHLLLPAGRDGALDTVRTGAAALLAAAAAALLVRLFGRILPKRRRVVTVAAAGVLCDHGDGSPPALIPWETLAAVGIHRYGTEWTLELCPREEVDRDDPALWLFVRDEQPHRPGLPRLRYRFDIHPAEARHAVAAACRRRVPRLWYGGHGHHGDAGAPDRKGHRRRLRASREGHGPAVGQRDG